MSLLFAAARMSNGMPLTEERAMATKKKSSKASKTSKTSRTRKATKSAAKRPAAKRELIAPRSDKRYVRRSKTGQFAESDDQGRSLGSDVRRDAKNRSKPGQGDKGDRS
jgi:hypothetical protein